MVFEPEETVGWIWHRLVGDATSYPRHPHAAVHLADLQGSLAVLFRALGGERGVRLVPAGEVAGRHQLGLRQRIGIGRERLARATLDNEVLQLPSVIDCFPASGDNRALYEWLAAFFAHSSEALQLCDDSLQADIATLRLAAATTARVLHGWPGLREPYDRLASALDALRPQRARAAWERRIEEAVRRVLRRDDLGQEDLLDATVPLAHFVAPGGYRPFLPVPLWGEVRVSGRRRESSALPDEQAMPGKAAYAKRRRAVRRKKDRNRRGEPLVLNRFELLLASAELVDLDRDVDDDDAEAAKQAADELDELVVSEHERRSAATLKLDLELCPANAETTPIQAELCYPEWDYLRARYRPNYCRVVAKPATEGGGNWIPDEAAQRRIREVRRYFEAFRPLRQIVPGQVDGDELDLSALVRARADLRAGNAAKDRLYLQTRKIARDLAVGVLVDVSLSTDSVIDDHRVLEIEQEALTALVLGLQACGDENAVFAFTSLRRSWVSVSTVKDFHEALDARILRRIRALRPGHYTRMGAAIRHVTARLAARPHRHRFLLLLTDGKPNDIDHYEGRYAVEDTRMAILEARRSGLKVFGITVDEHAQAYFPYIFGRGAYAIFPHVARLTSALPAMYRQIAT